MFETSNTNRIQLKVEASPLSLQDLLPLIIVNHVVRASIL